MTTIATSQRSDVTTVAHQPQAANGLAIVRVTIGAMFVWVFFENLGKGLYTPAGSRAGHDRDLSRYPARHRSAYPAGRICGFSVPRQPLDFGVGHLVDLGTAGSGARIARARYRTRRPEMGR